MIGLVKNYSEMLNRIAIAAFAVSALVAWLVVPPAGSAALVFKSLELPIPSEMLGIKGIAPLYVAAGILAVLLSRVLLLHDRISDIFGIRRRFDRDCILRPMAQRSGFNVTARTIATLDAHRHKLMGRVFYAYADPHKPVINAHLIHTALDRWSWYWIVVEAIVFCTAGLLILAAVGNWYVFLILLLPTSLLVVLSLLPPKQRAKAAEAQIEEILQDAGREKAVLEAFRSCGI